jgi:hypothetical protein
MVPSGVDVLFLDAEELISSARYVLRVASSQPPKITVWLL